MVLAVSSEDAAQGRRQGKNPAGEVRWYTDFIGGKAERVEDRPESNLVEMDAHQTVQPHFHQVNQFQIMAAGGGSIGRNPLTLIAVHYVDHHTAYGPIKSGPQGLALFTIRAQSDPSATYLHQPGYKEALRPSKQRYLLAENVQVTVDAILEHRKNIALESILPGDTDTSDGLGAFVLRMGAGMNTAAPDPRATGGQYLMVLKGVLRYEGRDFPPWSMLYAGKDDAPLHVAAGPRGLEALVLHFPRMEG